jgi:hypothetical protein
MAKVVEETISVRLSRLVRNNVADEVITSEQRDLLNTTILQICEELLGDNTVVAEIVEE